jgi:hypothetical protein
VNVLDRYRWTTAWIVLCSLAAIASEILRGIS